MNVSRINTADYSYLASGRRINSAGDDLVAMQKEVEQLKFSIQDAAKGTEFNKISLLDGSRADLNIATNRSKIGDDSFITKLFQ